MKSGTRWLWVLVAVAILALWPLVGQANLIQNPSFEDGPDDFVDGHILISSDINNRYLLPYWVVVTNQISYYRVNSGITTPYGGRFVDLNGLTSGAIRTRFDIPTVSGQKYKLTFYLAGNFTDDTGYRRVRVTADDTFQDFIVYNYDGWSGADPGWTKQTLTFTADGSTSVQFVSINPSSYGPMIDNVSLELVPLPGSLLLVGTGLLGLGSVGWRRRQRL